MGYSSLWNVGLVERSSEAGSESWPPPSADHDTKACSPSEKLWRWSGGDWRIGRVRKNQGTRGMGQPAGLKRLLETARGEALSQAVLSAPIRLGAAPAAGYHGGRRIRDLVEWSLQASVEAPAPTAPRPRIVRRLSARLRASGTLPSHLCPGAVATELPVCAPAM
jgi:hypothetical protein